MKDGKIHSDSKSKVLTFLLYLNEEWVNEKGLLRMLKNNSDLEDFIQEIPASFGVHGPGEITILFGPRSLISAMVTSSFLFTTTSSSHSPI